MAISEFWLNLKTAASLFAPATVQTDSKQLDPNGIERTIDRAVIWLTPRSVAGYDPNDFMFLDEQKQADLRTAIERFLEVAKTVPGAKPAAREQETKARAAFGRILEILQPFQFHDPEAFRMQTLLWRELRSKLPQWVTDITCETGLDVAEDPAMWVWIHVTDAAADRRLVVKHGQKIEDQQRRLSITRRSPIPLYPLPKPRTEHLWSEGMSLATELLHLAKKSVNYKKTDLLGVRLRRAISTAYYALFHLLLESGSAAIVVHAGLRHLVSRAYTHGDMQKAAKGFLSGVGGLPGHVTGAFAGAVPAVPQEITRIAGTFIVLQEARHEADYDLARVFLRADAQRLVARADQAFTDWKSICGNTAHTEIRELFLTSLLIGERWKK